MILDVQATKRPQTTCQIYCAEILGLHDTYRFERYFLPVEADDSRFLDDPDETTIKTSFDMLEEGIYEMSIKYVDSVSNLPMLRHRIWICLYRDIFFFIYNPKHVMAALEGYNALYEAYRLGVDIFESLDNFFGQLARSNFLNGCMPPWVRYDEAENKLLYIS